MQQYLDSIFNISYLFFKKRMKYLNYLKKDKLLKKTFVLTANIPIFLKIKVKQNRYINQHFFLNINNRIKSSRRQCFCFILLPVVKKKMMTLGLSLLFVFVELSYGLNNGLGRTPQMGKLIPNTSCKGNDTMTLFSFCS